MRHLVLDGRTRFDYLFISFADSAASARLARSLVRVCRRQAIRHVVVRRSSRCPSLVGDRPRLGWSGASSPSICNAEQRPNYTAASAVVVVGRNCASLAFTVLMAPPRLVTSDATTAGGFRKNRLHKYESSPNTKLNKMQLKNIRISIFLISLKVV